MNNASLPSSIPYLSLDSPIAFWEKGEKLVAVLIQRELNYLILNSNFTLI